MMNKKIREVIQVDNLDADDSRMGISSDITLGSSPRKINANPESSQNKIAPMISKNPPCRGFKASMGKKEAQTDVSLNTKEHEIQQLDFSQISEKTKISPGMPKGKPKFK